jgi:ankyrin repeat protein
MLLDLGADPNQADDNGAYPLTYSSIYIAREPTFFYLLLEKGADLDAMADGGVDLLLMIIALEETGQGTKHLLKKKPALLHTRPGRTHQSSLLGYAIMMGSPGTVSAILDAGAKATNLEFGALSMLDCAAGSSTRHSIETLKVLLAHEATDSERVDRLSRALCLACQRGNPTGIQFLLQSGADPNYVPADSRKLPPPIVGAWTRLRSQQKTKSTTPHQLAVEEREFQAVRQILKQHGLNESRFVLDDTAYEKFRGRDDIEGYRDNFWKME